MAEKSLAAVIAGVLGVATTAIAEDSSPETLRRWDSLSHLDLMTAVEDAFSIRFTAAEMMQARTVGDIRRLLREKGAEPG